MIETFTGPGTLDALGTSLDDLHAATAAPVTARRPWLRVWERAFTASEPWAIVVRDEASGCLDAAAVLCRSRRLGVTEVATMGNGRNDRSRMPARSPEAAGLLAEAIVEQLRLLAPPWTLRMEQLPAEDAVAAGVLRLLPSARRVRAAPVPKVEFAAERQGVDAYLGKGMRKQLRRCRERVLHSGFSLDVTFDAGPAGIGAVISQVEQAHRDRDHQVGRSSDIDCPEGLRFWREVVSEHAEMGQVEVAILRLGGELAAYVISLLDGCSYRVFDGRFAPEWSQFSPGRLVETATLERALVDPHYTHLDWMNSVASEKLVAANAVEPTIHLVACSPDLLRRGASAGTALVLDEGVEGRPTGDLALMALAGVDPHRAPG